MIKDKLIEKKITEDDKDYNKGRSAAMPDKITKCQTLYNDDLYKNSSNTSLYLTALTKLTSKIRTTSLSACLHLCSQ